MYNYYRCARCGRTRPRTEMAVAYRDGNAAWLCHGAWDESPTCYMHEVLFLGTGKARPKLGGGFIPPD